MDNVINDGNVASVIVGDDCSDIFITDKDTFDAVVRYYKNGDKVLVEDVDEDFSASEKYKEFTVTLKQPDQFDCSKIAASSPRINPDIEKFDVREFAAMEMARLFVLIRKWSLSKELNNDNILNINPKIMKGILVKIRKQIGMDGIF